MATTNYGLPTFNGAEADKPIQFESTITQGFQKIDQIMKENADASGPVPEIAENVGKINTQLQAMAHSIQDGINTQLNSYAPITVPHGINFSGNFDSYKNGLMLVVYGLGYITGDIPKNTVIMKFAGNPCNAPAANTSLLNNILIPFFTTGTADIGYIRSTVSYNGVDTVVTITSQVNGPASGTYKDVLFNLILPISNTITTGVEASDIDVGNERGA